VVQPSQFPDQTQYVVTLSSSPKRIISLVPSQTEVLADLGLEDRVVGITKFCIHPHPWQKSKTIVGGTKSFDFDRVHQLQPDLILGNKEENYQEGIQTLREKYPVWLSDIETLDDALRMIQSIGAMTQTEVKAELIANSIREAFRDVALVKPKSVLYLIWKNPWMAAGRNTFIHTVLEIAGWKNIVAASRYPTLTSDDLKTLSPDYIFLSSEPFPFQQKHVDELSQLTPKSKIVLVDGEMFSWYGSRLLKTPAYLHSLRGSLER
jgi:ABC-type Fe3+-hydroxamate transport system substrate-binding protein